MFKVPMTEQQFNCAKLKLTQNPDTILKMHDHTTGVLKTKFMQMYYEYQPENGVLFFYNGGKLDPNAEGTVEDHFRELVGDLKCPELPLTTEVENKSENQETVNGDSTV